jgi:hypothetical protein
MPGDLGRAIDVFRQHACLVATISNFRGRQPLSSMSYHRTDNGTRNIHAIISLTLIPSRYEHAIPILSTATRFGAPITLLLLNTIFHHIYLYIYMLESRWKLYASLKQMTPDRLQCPVLNVSSEFHLASDVAPGPPKNGTMSTF